MYFNYKVKLIDYKSKFEILNTLIQYVINNSIHIHNFIMLPKKRKKFTVLRSPHVHKKAQEQFEFLTYKNMLYFTINKYVYKEIKSIFKVLKFNLFSELSSQIIKEIKKLNFILVKKTEINFYLFKR